MSVLNEKVLQHFKKKINLKGYSYHMALLSTYETYEKIIFSVSIHLNPDMKKCVTFSSLVRCLSGSVISCLTKATYAMKSCSAAAQRHTNSFRMVMSLK